MSSDSRRAINGIVGVCEVVFAFGISPYLYGVLLVMAGLVAFRSRTSRLLPWALLFIGLSHVTARFVADILKPPFSRLRPFEALGSDGWHDTWFATVGNSFPSGHSVHFWSLFFPLAVLFPQYRVPLVVLPLFVSAARIAVNDHYLSDILASAALAALVTWAYAIAILERGLKRAV
jgi:membrane-associated phospholipid phosphatase